MKTPVEVFDEVLAANPDLGPRFHPIPDEIVEPFHDQRAVFKGRMDAIRKQFLPNRSIDVYLDFIDNGECNAVACIHDFLGIIALNKGLILLPQDLFWRMFSHPGFLPKVGDPKGERRGAQHDDGIFDNYDHLVLHRRRANRADHAHPPSSSARRRMAEVCMDLTWRFIAMHELVHIMHGHCDYLANSHAAPFILDAASHLAIPPLSQENLDLQAIEVSADAVAAAVVLRGFLNLSPLVGVYAGLDDARQKLFLWSLTLFTLFRTWDFRIDVASIAQASHPPPAIRFAILMTFVSYDAAVDSFGIGWDEYLAIVKSGQVAAEVGIGYCGGEALRQIDLDLLRDPAIKAHRDALFEHCDTVLFPEFEKRAYVALRQT